MDPLDHQRPGNAVHVIVGRHAVLEHFVIGLSQGRTETKMRTGSNVVPWPAVVRFGRGALIVRDGTELS